MSWEDHTIYCVNRSTGQTARFVYSKYADAPFTHFHTTVPWLLSTPEKQEKAIFSDCFGSIFDWNYLHTWENRGWDLRPLVMHENKPHEKAYLLYNEKTDEYCWFVDNEESLGSSTRLVQQKQPWYAKYYENHVWRLDNITWRHESKEYYKEKGWIFPELGEVKVTKSVEKLQSDLIDYCSKKSTRTTHLKALTRLGALNPAWTWDEVATTIKDYLNTEESVCTDGAARAINALGLSDVELVQKELSVDEILVLVRKGERVYFTNKKPRSDNPYYPTTSGTDALYNALCARIPLDFVMKVWVKENV